MRSWISAYMKLSGSEDAVQCGDKEGRNDDHAFWLEAAETGETLAKKGEEREREREKIEAMLPLCPPFQQGNEKSICIAAHRSLLISILHLSLDQTSGGILPAGRWEYLSFLYKLFNCSNRAFSFIINHKNKTLWCNGIKGHQFKLCKSF